MTIIRRFQETHLHSDINVEKEKVKQQQKQDVSFWALAAEGISSWHAKHRLAALSDQDPGEGDEALALLAASSAAAGDY